MSTLLLAIQHPANKVGDVIVSEVLLVIHIWWLGGFIQEIVEMFPIFRNGQLWELGRIFLLVSFSIPAVCWDGLKLIIEVDSPGGVLDHFIASGSGGVQVGVNEGVQEVVVVGFSHRAELRGKAYFLLLMQQLDWLREIDIKCFIYYKAPSSN